MIDWFSINDRAVRICFITAEAWDGDTGPFRIKYTPHDFFPRYLLQTIGCGRTNDTLVFAEVEALKANVIGCLDNPFSSISRVRKAEDLMHCFQPSWPMWHSQEFEEGPRWLVEGFPDLVQLWRVDICATV